MSKLEPHLVQPVPDEDVDLFLQAVDSESDRVSPASKSACNQQTAEESSDKVKQGFVRLVDYLKKRKNKDWQSYRSMALRAYEVQQYLFDNKNNNSLKTAI